MARLLQALLRFAAYTSAAIVILLAVALGLFRLFLPRLPEYQDNIKAWASAAIGVDVQFTGMNARWGLSGPEVEFYNAELTSQETQTRIVAADKVSVGIGLTRIFTDRKAVVDRVVVQQSSIEVRQLENGQWWIQGRPPDELLPRRQPASDSGEVAAIEIFGEDLTLHFLQPGDQRPHDFLIPSLRISRDDNRLAIDASVELPSDVGDNLSITATQLFAENNTPRQWEVILAAEDIELAGVSALLQNPAARFDSGRGNLNLSFQLLGADFQSATAEVEFDEIGVAGGAEFSCIGRLEFMRASDGWLVAADNYRLSTENGTWPLSTLRVDAGTAADGSIDALDIQASYLKLEDVRLLYPWLPEKYRQLLADLAPDGVVSDLNAELGDLGSDAPRFVVAARFNRIGIAAYEKFPGVRGFSGTLRADRSGGLFEIASIDMSVDLPQHLPDPVLLDEMRGTLIWRRGDQRTTLLSDSIVVRNADFSFESNVEMSLEDGQRLPVVDLASNWSVNDISIAKKYIPFIPRIPRTSEWFQEGLLAGSIPKGSIRLYGPLDKWPFDGGEGRFLVQANLRDGLILYQRRWPLATIPDLDIVVDNMRLYTDRNVIINEGNRINNAHIEIGDFRSPVLKVSGASSGSLDAMRQLLANSPIGVDVFKGNLERVAVTGDGAFDLDLSVPVRDWQSFEFTARVQAEDASMQIEGLPAPLTALSGTVTVERENISSEALGGIFLGRPINIELFPAPPSMPDYRVIASASGSATAEALISEMGLPLADSISGATDFSARLLFARGEQEQPKPFSIEVSSSLEGLAIDLPQPFYKEAAEVLPVVGNIELPSDSDTITTQGIAQSLLSWQMSFIKSADRWDLDRGTVNFGDEPAATAETRGLHFRGHAEAVQMQDWMDRMHTSRSNTGIGDRIRSVDMQIDNLYLLGQHIVAHRVRLDRSADDWLVQFDGPEITGTASVPYDFNAGRALVIDMQRLVLPGDDDDPQPATAQMDPRSLPPITVKAGEFALGTRFLGAVSADLERTVDGLQTSNLVAKDKTFEITGSGRWVFDESDPAGSHSYMLAKLSSTNVEATMARLGYNPGIVSDELSLSLDLNWSGGPRNDFRDSLNGEAVVRIGIGQLSDVEPGAGRMMGLMSVVALPRRLSLDFRDVFGKGFGFDLIRGRFELVDGQAITCNLSLDGPAAQIAVVGRAGLVERDYDQTAVVSANFGNALPVVGAALGGPTVAAVVLIFSQIFKKPLAEVGQIYYGISGSWDEPEIESVTAAEFAAQGVRRACITEAE